MPAYDVVIKDGIIVDGTRAPRYRGDVAIRNGKIAEIGHVTASNGARVLDASGLVVAPGFIDLHTHYDAQVFWDPYCSLSGWHGITSVVIGNCGFGFAPVRPEERERMMLSMTRVEAIPLASMAAGMPWTWTTFPEFLDAVQKTPKAVNILPYMPAGPLLAWVLGLEDAKAGRRPTDPEHAEIRRLFAEALDAGACGWSAQQMVPGGPGQSQRDFDGTPMPTDVMHIETCLELCKVMRERNQGFIQILRNSGDAEDDRRKCEELSTASGRPLIFNLVKAFDDNPEIHRGVLSWLKRCRERGIRVYGQGLTTDAGFTFTFEDWNLFDDSEPWCEATTGTMAERLAKLSDPDRRPALRDNMPYQVTGPIADIVVTGPESGETEPFRNLKISDVADRTGKHVVDALLDIAVADRLKTEFYLTPPNTSLKYLREIVDDPWVLFGVSDGGAHTKFSTAGRYPTETIVNLVRTHEMLSLEEVHWRLSTLPAMFAGFQDRGVLRVGAPADVIVYDYENLEALPEEVTHDLPGGEWRRVQRASGYRWVLVNGRVTIEDDRETGTHSGQLLRHGTG